VLLTDDPSEQQKLGKLCTGYINGIWAGARQAIAMRGLLAKFSQNADLRSNFSIQRMHTLWNAPIVIRTGLAVSG
jgi:predicted NAD-dependent protein-ADP-ribosyltransferase YbiA (DUF1768 family)